MAYSRPSSYPYPRNLVDHKGELSPIGVKEHLEQLYKSMLENDSRGEYAKDKDTDKDLKELIVRPEWYGAKRDGGHDDTAAIQAAAGALLSAGGGILFLSNGIYKITSDLILPDNVSVIGASREASVLYISANDRGILAGNYCTISNFTLRGTKTVGGWGWGIDCQYNDDAPGLDLGRDMTDAKWDGAHLTVYNMVIEKFSSGGLTSGPHSFIFNNEIRDCYGEGMLIQADDVSVRDNYIRDVPSWGIDINACDCKVVNNHLYNCGDLVVLGSEDGGGIVLANHTQSGGMHGNIVSGNMIDTSTIAGIVVYAAVGTDYELTDCSVCGNTIRNVNTSSADPNSAAIVVNDASTSRGKIKNINVTNNVIKTTTVGHGIRIFDASGVIVANNDLQDIADIGIWVYKISVSPIYISITGNNIRNFGSYGIDVISTNHVNISNNIIGPNANAHTAIFVLNSNNYVLTGNNIYGNMTNGYGVYVSGTSAHGIVSSNIIKDCLCAVYYDSSGGELEIVGNNLGDGNGTTIYWGGTITTVRAWRNTGVEFDAIVYGSLKQSDIVGMDTDEIPAFKNITIEDIAPASIPYRTALTDKITDGGLENWDSTTNLTSWQEVIFGTSTINREGTEKHGGTYACRIDIDSSSSVAGIVQPVTLVASSQYKISLWYKTEAGRTVQLDFRDLSDTVYLRPNGLWTTTSEYIILPASTAWTQYIIYFQSHASYTAYRIAISRESQTSSSFYIDDISIEDTGILGDSPLSTDGTDVDNDGVYKKGGVQVVGAQGAAVADATDATSVILRLNELLARQRAHGLIAT